MGRQPGAWIADRVSEVTGAKVGSLVGTGMDGVWKKGLNEMGGNCWDSDDVWDLNGIHLGPHWLTGTIRCHAGSQANCPVVRPSEPDPHAEQIQCVPGDGRGRGEFGAHRQLNANPVPFDA